MEKLKIKNEFEKKFVDFARTLNNEICDEMNNWTIKGFIDAHKNIYSISNDTKIISKILEIHIFPLILQLAEEIGYNVVLTDHQNYYPDISFVCQNDERIKFAVDFKSTYRKSKNTCNGFTLGSHGKYFQDRTSTKNIQFPYSEYLGHFCLGVIYDRVDTGQTEIFDIDELSTITSVIKNIDFFFVEKWRIASDKRGSGNTANIGSVKNIDDVLKGNGIFKLHGESVFDDYWMNYGNIIITKSDGKTEKINCLDEFLKYKGID